MTREKAVILQEIKELTREYFSSDRETSFVPGKSKIPLNVLSSYNWEESYEAIESILTTWVTMGKKVKSAWSLVRVNRFTDLIGKLNT